MKKEVKKPSKFLGSMLFKHLEKAKSNLEHEHDYVSQETYELTITLLN